MSLYHSVDAVAIVGRPNVGKSTLFNKLTRTRKAVVKDQPGVTRDILMDVAHWWGRSFRVMDTGGWTDDASGLSPLVRDQVENLLREVRAIIWVMDARSGLLPEDRDIYKMILKSGRPFIIAINKVDRVDHSVLDMAEFFEFGEDLVSCSFEQDFGIDTLVEWVLKQFPEAKEQGLEGVRLTLVGKPNAGKSSLCNWLLNQDRMIVSDIAGTTIDAVETEFELDGEKVILVDTAGLRKNANKDDLEMLSLVKTREAIARSDLVIVVIDGMVGPTHQDADIVEQCLKSHKAFILAINKHDIAAETLEHYRAQIEEKLQRTFHFFPNVLFEHISAHTGFGVERLKAKIAHVQRALTRKIPTSQLNRFFAEVIKRAPSPVYGSTNVKFYYLTQTHQKPPSFIAFANHPEGVTPAYRRFLANQITEAFELKGIPIRIFVMPKGHGSRSRKAEEYAGHEG